MSRDFALAHSFKKSEFDRLLLRLGQFADRRDKYRAQSNKDPIAQSPRSA